MNYAVDMEEVEATDSMADEELDTAVAAGEEYREEAPLSEDQGSRMGLKNRTPSG